MSSAHWLSAVDPAFVERRFGADAISSALARPRVYASPPMLEGSRLVATVIDAIGDRLSTPMKVAVRVQDSIVDFACACRSRHLCEHALWLLVDTAFHPALTEAVIAQQPTDQIARDLPAMRARALEERTLDERLDAWLPPRRFETDLEIDIDAAMIGNPGDERAAVLVRHRRKARLVAAKDVLASRLAPKHRRLVELTAPYHADRDVLVATRGQASLLVHLLREEIGVFAGSFKSKVRFGARPVSPRAEAHGDRLVARWVDDVGTVMGEASDTILFSGPFPYLWTPHTFTFHPIADTVDLDAALGMQRVPSLPIHQSMADRVGRELLVRGRGLGVALPAPEVFGLPPLEKPAFELRISGSPLDLHADLLAIYQVGKIPVIGKDAVRGPATDGRDLEAEEAALRILEEAGFTTNDRGELIAAEDRAVGIWQGGLAKLRASEEPHFDIIIAETIAKTKIATLPITIDVKVESRVGWLDAELEFRAGSLRVELARMHEALASNSGWVVLSDGALVRISEQVAALVDEVKAMHFVDGKLAAHQLGRIARWMALRDSPLKMQVDEEAKQLIARVQSRDEVPELRLPEALQASLRPYQRIGLGWLVMLSRIGAGGLLADDMGLGKTLMTLAFLAHEAPVEGRRVSLVVCPTSVVGNWIREAARFTPSLRIANWTSSDRALSAFEENDVVVTSYGILRREIARLSPIPFRIVVLDEAQNIKNPRADTSRAARSLDAAMRLALTGTPVENRLSELWSIMTFANPGILGSAKEFEERFELPIAAATASHLSRGVNAPRPGDDKAVSAELRALVRPFILRRTKDEVLVDLPPKTEVERACVFGMRQKRLYDALALSVREAVSKVDWKRRNARTHLSVLTAILRLRQMACDPRLVDPSIAAADSAKRLAFLDLVRELVSEDRRALVFSQFVELLQLWKADLDEAKVAYEYLDGSTRDRDAVVDRFQNGAAPLFLISLKAGGAGLNLTAADTVIHCDPWWNPAVEDQATDRAHRIGQTKPVTVVRLVASGTIEDKIEILKDKKRELVEAVFEEGQAHLGGLTEDDLTTLLGNAEMYADEEAD